MRILLALLVLGTATVASADTRVTVTSPAVNDLELTAVVEPTMFDVTLTLKNVGKKPLDVMSHVAVGTDTHYDWYEIEITWPKAGPGGACSGTGKLVLELKDSRKKASPVASTLAPGAAISHTLSVPAWAKRTINGGAALGGSFYKVVARYRVKDAPKVWNGELVTPPAKVFALDQMRTDVCRTNPGWDKW